MTSELSSKYHNTLLLFLAACIANIFFALDSISRWGISHDIAILSLNGWLVSQGSIPYKDFLEYNTPITILIYYLQIYLLGSTDLAWRISIVAWFGLGVWGIYRFLLRSPLIFRVFACVVYVLTELHSGHWIAGQKDFFAGIFLIHAAAILVKHKLGLSAETKTLSSANVILAGTLAGVAIGIRPHLVIILLGLYIFEFRSVFKSTKYFLLFFFASLLPWISSVIYLLLKGNLNDYFVMVYKFLIPIYSKLGSESFSVIIGNLLSHLGFFLLIPLFISKANNKYLLEYKMASVVFLCGIISYVIQMKGWIYHLSPVVPFYSVLISLTTYSLCRSSSANLFIVRLLMILIVISYSKVGLLSPRKLKANNTRVADDIAADILKYDFNLISVQPLDVTGGAIHALLKIKKQPATKWIYDVYLLNEINTEFVKDQRGDFIKEIGVNPPGLFILTSFSWPAYSQGFSRINKFTDLRSFLEKRYKICDMNKFYWIYTREDLVQTRNCLNPNIIHESLWHNRIVELSNSKTKLVDIAIADYTNDIPKVIDN